MEIFMVKRNSNIAKLKSGYLFPEIDKRKKQLLESNPEAQIISLGIGNTTQHLSPFIIQGLTLGVERLSNNTTYTGYGDSEGLKNLREKISATFYSNKFTCDEVFVSDGAKCDCGRLQQLFGPDVSVAVQDPAYPVYVDGSVIVGATGEYDENIAGFKKISYMHCAPENNFFPRLKEPTDLIYFCSPNNPTGAVATHAQLSELVNFAKKNNSIIIFDAAYAQYIQDSSLPKSIYEIPGAEKVAIEVNSFSKPFGFTGVRLGWTIIPKLLKYDDGTSVNQDWTRLVNTIFNGASNIAQAGGIAALEPQGLDEMKKMVSYYLENAQVINDTLLKLNIPTFGGFNSPFIWAKFEGKNSWDVFNSILNNCHVLTTPGSGFGPAGEGFIRFSAFGHRKNILKATQRLLSSSWL